MEPELTEVGELHSLTDWQVSEASEEAELDEFCSQEGPRAGTACRHKGPPVKNKKMGRRVGEEGHATERETDMHREKDERSRVRVVSPQSSAHAEASKPWKRSVTPSETQTRRTVGHPGP